MESSTSPFGDGGTTGAKIGLVLGSVACILVSACCSGLTLGLLSLDLTELNLLIQTGTPDEKRYAAIIRPVRLKANMLLCTLVFGNVAVTSLSTMLLASLLDETTGLVLNTFLIVILGEIVPQALCSGKYQLMLGAYSVPLVQLFVLLLYPICKPLSMVLDWALGAEEGMAYNRDKLRELAKMQVLNSGLRKQEGDIISGALHLTTKRVLDVYTPRADMYSLKASDRLDGARLGEIFSRGFSRIPVWDEAGEACVGLLYAKDLVLIRPEMNHPCIVVVSHFKRMGVAVVDAGDSLEAVLKGFIAAKNHFALVRDVVEGVGGKDSTYRIIGLVTMEDILGFLLNNDIGDESGGGGDSADPRGFHPPSFLACAASNGLSHAALRAVAAHLLANVPPFSPHRFTMGALEGALRAGATLVTTGPGEERVLASRKQPLVNLVLVLSGGLKGVSGEDGIPHSFGPWEVVGEKALTVEDYRADFTATLQPTSTCLCIPRGLFVDLGAGRFDGGSGGVGLDSGALEDGAALHISPPS